MHEVSRDTLKRFWWLHDSFWHAALVRELGHETANRINLAVAERFFRMMTYQLLRQGLIQRPRSIQELMGVFRVVWKNAFFDDLYVEEPIYYEGETATWIGMRCHVYESISRAGMLAGYACGCQAVRNGVMRALRLRPLHEIKESLVKGDGRCVIVTTFAPQ